MPRPAPPRHLAAPELYKLDRTHPRLHNGTGARWGVAVGPLPRLGLGRGTVWGSYGAPPGSISSPPCPTTPRHAPSHRTEERFISRLCQDTGSRSLSRSTSTTNTQVAMKPFLVSIFSVVMQQLQPIKCPSLCLSGLLPIGHSGYCCVRRASCRAPRVNSEQQHQ